MKKPYKSIQWLSVFDVLIATSFLKGMNYVVIHTSWSDKELRKLSFTPKVWVWLEKQYDQFIKGNHSITKAYQNFLSLTDEYDFCWGIDERLWAVYAKSLGEIYIVKSNNDLTDWESETKLVFSPSGSRKPAICILPEGNYEIAVEIEPAGEAIPEIWLMSHPFTGENIRRICNGFTPKLLYAFGQLYLFYNLDNYTICYRSSADGFAVEYKVDGNSSEPIYLKKVVSIVEEDRGHIIMFYWRDNDFKPLKYLDANSFFFDKGCSMLSLTGLEWIRCEQYERFIDEIANTSLSVTDIEWILVGPIESNLMDNGEAQITMQKIDWVEIQSQPIIIEEKADAVISIQSILWIEV